MEHISAPTGLVTILSRILNGKVGYVHITFISVYKLGKALGIYIKGRH